MNSSTFVLNHHLLSTHNVPVLPQILEIELNAPKFKEYESTGEDIK